VLGLGLVMWGAFGCGRQAGAWFGVVVSVPAWHGRQVKVRRGLVGIGMAGRFRSGPLVQGRVGYGRAGKLRLRGDSQGMA